MSADVKLPETVEEFQRARRAAFESGAVVGACSVAGSAAIAEEARRRYPITRKVPRVVELLGGIEVKMVDGDVYSRRPGFAEWLLCTEGGRPENIRRLADLLANPYEEVTE